MDVSDKGGHYSSGWCCPVRMPALGLLSGDKGDSSSSALGGGGGTWLWPERSLQLCHPSDLWLMADGVRQTSAEGQPCPAGRNPPAGRARETGLGRPGVILDWWFSLKHGVLVLLPEL